jgi:hypothetical protein
MDDAAEAERYWQQYGAQLSEAFGIGETIEYDDTNALADGLGL